ncbi:MAG TPA: LLM class F420-dependent oxidoreductase [Candidatus Solibacter sp.]|nr:LLM class F420-dependent oxidoreductase [Candidatus Solibacter sp.]
MKLGVVFPQNESSADPGALRDYVQAVEAMGYDHLEIYDHVLGASPDRPGGWNGPYTHEHLFHEVLVTLGYLAGVTTRLELVTAILILPQRQTALVAKQAAEVDLLSGGRLRLGVGLGWNRVEMEGLGEDYSTRGRRMEEQVALLRRLWTEPLIDFTGDFNVISNAGINPLPGRQIPIWMGGTVDAAKRRAARLADGWMMNLPIESDPYAALDEVRGYVAEAGREVEAFGVDVRVGVRKGVEETAQRAGAWRDRGVSHVSINTMAAGLAWPQGHIDALKAVREVLDPS